MNFLVFLASQKHNQTLANALLSELKSAGASANIIDLVDLNLPLYTSAHHHDHGLPDEALAVYEACKKSDGFIFVSPEYNGGIPPVLTNTIAWLSVIGSNWRDAFNGKMAAIASHSGGNGAHLVIGLRIQLAYIGLTVIGRSLQTSAKSPLKEERVADFINHLLNLRNG